MYVVWIVAGGPEDIRGQRMNQFATTTYLFTKIPTLVSDTTSQNSRIFYDPIDLPSNNTISEAREVDGTILRRATEVRQYIA